MGKTSAGSAANAACDHVRNLFLGTREGEHVSMAVLSDGNPWGIEEGLMFSCPVHIKKGGEWSFANVELSEETKVAIKKNIEELKEERSIALNN
jgi:malate/lactate dehydrogenase